MTDYAPDELAWRRPTGPTALRLPRPSAGRRAQHRGRRQPVYWRILGLRRLRPNAWQRAALGEGVAAVAAVLVLADLASAWTLLVLPLAVAAVVKGHDVLASVVTAPVGPMVAPVGLNRLTKVTARPHGRHRRSGQAPSADSHDERSQRVPVAEPAAKARHRHRGD